MAFWRVPGCRVPGMVPGLRLPFHSFPGHGQTGFTRPKKTAFNVV
jgi:hypothetical protein